MPENKKQNARIRTINECLISNKKCWSKNELIEAIAKRDINISTRTLDQDIFDMRSCQQLKLFAPIEYSKAKNGYFYTDVNYSIDNIPLTKEDIKALEVAATTLKQYQYIPIMKEFTTTIDKIIRVVNRAKNSNHESILDFIEFEKTPISLGIEFIDTLITAIQTKRALEIVYQKFGYHNNDRQTFHPYYLKEYRNRWYVIGFNENKNQIRTYGLDRIKSLVESAANHIQNTYIDTKEYLGKCVGINLMKQKVEKVRLVFSPKESSYITTQAIHKSQDIIKNSKTKGLTVEYELIINYEFIGILLSYGSDVKVLKPKSLVDKITAISNRVIKQYA